MVPHIQINYIYTLIIGFNRPMTVETDTATGHSHLMMESSWMHWFHVQLPRAVADLTARLTMLTVAVSFSSFGSIIEVIITSTLSW